MSVEVGYVDFGRNMERAVIARVGSIERLFMFAVFGYEIGKARGGWSDWLATLGDEESAKDFVDVHCVSHVNYKYQIVNLKQGSLVPYTVGQ